MTPGSDTGGPGRGGPSLLGARAAQGRFGDGGPDPGPPQSNGKSIPAGAAHIRAAGPLPTARSEKTASLAGSGGTINRQCR